jgi:hypothetical protein
VDIISETSGVAPRAGLRGADSSASSTAGEIETRRVFAASASSLFVLRAVTGCGASVAGWMMMEARSASACASCARISSSRVSFSEAGAAAALRLMAAAGPDSDFAPRLTALFVALRSASAAMAECAAATCSSASRAARASRRTSARASA